MPLKQTKCAHVGIQNITKFNIKIIVNLNEYKEKNIFIVEICMYTITINLISYMSSILVLTVIAESAKYLVEADFSLRITCCNVVDMFITL